MPELPEVETIRRNLQATIVNSRIITIDVHDVRLGRPVQPDQLQKWAVGHRIVSFARRAKYIIVHLDNDAAIIIHLGMSGRLGVLPASAHVEKHTHVIFHLDDNRQLRYRDPRRFGLIEITLPGAIESYAGFAKLGVEPLSAAFNAQFLADHLPKSKKAIKLWIMDAQNIVGIGNIYANEALFFAGLHPARPAASLNRVEQRKLTDSIKSTLERALQLGGTTIRDFQNTHGEPGFFQQVLSVYQREGEKCKNCGTAIIKVVVGGRSTFFCPVCQK